VGPESVALDASRGYEDPTHKAYMRATVLVLDVLIYFSVVWVATKGKKKAHDIRSMGTLILALAQPALILMDHGHFQYNSVSLGFALWGTYFMTKENFSNCIIGSVFFCMALNFKQMTLYYAPAVFAYLLGRCFANEGTKLVPRFGGLGVTVIVTFVLHWWPFIYYPPSHDPQMAASERLVHVLHRMFPFQRGLFEGKVSNLWCALSTKPISIRQRLPESIQPMVALGTTLLLIMPACYKLFAVGQRRLTRSGPAREEDWKFLLWGSASTGLAFFLASFQVHEKSILMPLAPISLLVWEDATFCHWFSVVATWTLWPLIRVDRLEAAYGCILTIFGMIAWLVRASNGKTPLSASCFDCLTITKAIVPLSSLAMLSLHLLEMFVTPPASLPDLFPVLWSIGGCGMFCIAWVVTCWHLYSPDKAPSEKKTN
jgi:alpha-1,3-glucosyltransferase